MWNSLRLPNKIIPSAYDIHLRPYIEKLQLIGIINIKAEVKEHTNYIVLHGVNIKIGRAIIITAKNKSNEIPQISYDTEPEYIYLICKNNFDLGEILIYIEYEGMIYDDLFGCYKSSYIDKNHNKHWVLATQFESTYARRVFPCFDEPQFKATISLTLDINNKLTAFSNMPQKQRNKINNEIDRIVFQTSPKMSTYTFAFVIGEYNSLIALDKPYAVVAPPGNADASQFGLHVGVKSMEAYEDILGIKYSLPKLDLIMVPESAAGAMENWGLVTFRPAALLTYTDYSAETDKDYVAAVVSHELAHQFFGNLCTTKWWNTIWLNEGIATYFEYLGIDRAFPTWKIWDTFIFKAQQTAMYEDKFIWSHPLNNPVSSNAEIDEMFDTITYDKGGSILYMIADIVGLEVLYQGLHNYLTQCAYGNGTPSMLWNNIETIAKRPISELMKSWTDQAGFPLITVEEYQNGIILKQERYLTSLCEYENNQRWWISLRIGCSNGSQKRVEFCSEKSDFIPIDTKWYKINYNQHGFMRVNYPIETWMRIIESENLTLRDRAGLVNDALSLSLDAKLPIDVALYVAQRILSNEDEYVVWMSALGPLYKLSRLLKGNGCEKYFAKYMVDLIYPTFTRLWNSFIELPELMSLQDINYGYQNNNAEHYCCRLDHSQRLLISKLMTAGIYFKDPRTNEICGNLFRQWLNDPQSIPIDLQGPIFQNAVKNMGAYNDIFQLYMEEINVIQKKRYLNALTYSDSSEELNELLEAILDRSKVESQNRMHLIINVGLNNSKLTWEFIKKHWDVLNIRGQAIQHLVEVIIVTFHTEAEYNDAQEFFENHPSLAKLSMKRALETISHNIKWRSLYLHQACNWLKQYVDFQTKYS